MLTEATIFRGAFWFSIGALFERTMYFVLPIFIAPLGPAVLGIFYLSLRVFHGIVSFPTTALNIRYTGELRGHIQDPKSLQFEATAAFLLKVYFVTGLLVGMFFFILIVAVAPLKPLAFLALAIPFAVVNSYMLLLLQLLQRFKQIFFIQAIFAFGFQLLYMTIFIGFFKMGIAAAFAGQLLMAMLISIAASFFVFDRLNLLGIFGKISLKMFTLSRLSFTNLLFITLFPILDIALVGLLFGFSTLGYYIVLLYLPLLMHKIPTTLFGMFIHVAIVKTHKGEDLTEISKQVFKWILIITTPLFIVIVLYPEFLLSVIFHKTYVKDLGITRLLAISFFVQSLSWTAGRILIAKKKRLLYVVSNYIFGFVFVILSLIFGLSFGLLGIALAFLISSILDSSVKFILAAKTANVPFIGAHHIKIISAGVLASLVIFFFNNPFLFFPLFFVVYFSILWMANIVNHRAIFELKKMVAKEVAVGESNE